ncbi:MAG: metal ABC transporter substrate-binding protein [Chloroflexota bacterium]
MRRLPLLLAMLVAACGASGPPTPSTSDAGDQVAVVTTSSVFADLIQNVGGTHVSVTSLVPRGADVHTYQPTPADLRAVASADVFFMNGLGLDDWLEKTIRAASNGASVIKLAEELPTTTLLPGDSPATRNPHLWMDVTYASGYADLIGAALNRVDPADASAIDGTRRAYQQRLADLDSWVRVQIATIPPADRQFVMFHDALPYFARAYGLTVVGVAVEAPGQDPSAGEIGTLIDAIRRSGVRAIFSEDQFPTALIDQIARETGAVVVSNLYDDTLGDDPITSYEAMIRWDVAQLVGALR